MNFREYLTKGNKLSSENQEEFDLLSDNDIVSYDLTDPVKMVRMGKWAGTKFIPFKNKQEAKVSWGKELEDIVTITKKDFKKKFKV